MAKLGISTGSQPNDGTGDTLLSGAEKVNANFTEVYTLCGDGTNLAPGIVTAIAAGDNISISTTSGQVTVTALETTGISSYWNANLTGITTVARGVGIGTTTVTSKLTVVGGGNIGGGLTVSSGLVLTGGASITGETTLTGGLKVTGISSFTSVALNAVQVNVSGASTFTALVSAGNSTKLGDDVSTRGVNAGGISTFVGDVSIGNHFSVVGISTVGTGNTFNSEGGMRMTGIASMREAVIGYGVTISTTGINAVNDAYVGVSTAAGVILTSANGTRYRLLVENDGSLKTVNIA